MYWPDRGSGVDVEPDRKPVASAVRQFFTEGGPGVPPTVPGGDWFNQVTNELLNVLTAAGIDPSKADDDQLLQAITAIITSLSDTTLRSDLAGTDGVSLVGNAADKRGQVFTGEVSAQGLKSTDHYGDVIVGDNPMGSVGNDWPSSDSLRDAINVSRKLQVQPTNCHAFADKTIIDSPSDAGAYGSFDATLWVKGAHNQNHAYSFQDRTIYEGSGVIQKMTGLFSYPEHRGTGTIEERYGADINDINVSAGGAVTNNTGIRIRHLFHGAARAALRIEQIDAYAYYADGGGTMYQKGAAGFGVDPLSSPFPLNWAGAGGPAGLLTSDAANGAVAGVQGDFPFSIITNSGLRARVKGSALEYAFTPGSDNLQPLGDAANRWKAVYAGTGTIQTSDGKDKTPPELIIDTLLDVADDIEIIAYKWLQSIQEKGFDLARVHFGVIAQQVRDAFEKHSLDGRDYGLLCYDEWDDQFEDFVVSEEKVDVVVISPGHFANKTRQVERQVFNTSIVVRDVIKLVDDAYVLCQEKVTEHHPVVVEHPVFNPDMTPALDSKTGKPIIHTEVALETVDETYRDWVPPVTETRVTPAVIESRKVRAAGGRWGVRPDQLLFLLAATARHKHRLLVDRLSAIEKSLSL